MQPPEIAAYAVSGVGALLHLYIVEMSSYSGSVWTLMIHEISGLAMTSNVTFEDEVSGVLGLGFPRLSAIYNTVANGTAHFLEIGVGYHSLLLSDAVLCFVVAKRQS